MRKDVVIVIATYNEADNIENLLNQLVEYRVFIVDDNSPDGTGKLAVRYKNVHVLTRSEDRGIASAYHLGFRRALEFNPKYIIQMDAGLTHDPKVIPLMLSMMDYYKFINVIIGSRFKDYGGSSKGYRTFISKGAAYLMSKLVGRTLMDATSGFRCWREDVLRDIIRCRPLRFESEGFSFQLETLYLAVKLTSKYSIIETPIEYKLTNSSFKYKMIFEAFWIYLDLLKEKLWGS